MSYKLLTLNVRGLNNLALISASGYVFFFYHNISSCVVNNGPPGGGGYFRNFWVGMCRWDRGTLSLYQS